MPLAFLVLIFIRQMQVLVTIVTFGLDVPLVVHCAATVLSSTLPSPVANQSLPNVLRFSNVHLLLLLICVLFVADVFLLLLTTSPLHFLRPFLLNVEKKAFFLSFRFYPFCRYCFLIILCRYLCLLNEKYHPLLMIFRTVCR